MPMNDETIIDLVDEATDNQPWVLVWVKPSSGSGELDLKCLAGGGIPDTQTVFHLLRKAAGAFDRPEIVEEEILDRE